MTDAAIFRATYSDFKLVRSRKVVQLVFEVPLEKASEATTILGGMPNPGAEIWCAIARLHNAIAEDESANAPASTDSRMTTRCAILCNDPVFHRFLNETYRSSFPQAHVEDQKHAADLVRFLCDVQSRKEIIPGTRAGDKWDDIYSLFIAWRDAPDMVPA